MKALGSGHLVPGIPIGRARYTGLITSRTCGEKLHSGRSHVEYCCTSNIPITCGVEWRRVKVEWARSWGHSTLEETPVRQRALAASAAASILGVCSAGAAVLQAQLKAGEALQMIH